MSLKKGHRQVHGSQSPFTIVGFDYFRNRCHGWGQNLHDCRNCSSNLARPSHFDCDCGFCVSLSASPLQSLRLASFNQLEPIIVTSMPSLKFPWIGLVDSGIYDSRIGVASGWAAYFKGLLANLGWSLPTDFKQVLVQLRELMWISYYFGHECTRLP